MGALPDGAWRHFAKGPLENPVERMAYDDELGLLLVGTRYGVWSYDGSLWVNTEGAAGEYIILAVAVDAASAYRLRRHLRGRGRVARRPDAPPRLTA